MMRKTITLIFKLLKTVFVLLFSSVILYLAAALLLSFMKTHPPKTDCLADNEIYITTNGVNLFSTAKTNQSAPVLCHPHPVPNRPGSVQVFKFYFSILETPAVSCFSCSIFASSKKYSGRNFSCAISCFF
jgi:hypothetical protein